MTDKPAGEVVDLRARRGYRPDVESLACSKVATARKQAGLSVEAFAAALEPILGWLPAPDLVRTWESTVAPPGQVVIACEVVMSRVAGAQPENGSDEVASAACEAEAEQSWLLAEPGPQSVDALWDGALEIARAANRSALDMFSASRRIRCDALKLAEQTQAGKPLRLVRDRRPGDGADGVNCIRPGPLGRISDPGAVGGVLCRARRQRVLAGVDLRPSRAPGQLAQ